MVYRTIVKALALGTLAMLGGCGAPAKAKADTPKEYDWADYRGTFSKEPPTGAVAGPKVVNASGKEHAEPADKREAPKTETKSLPSRGTIKGESVSSVTAEAVASALKTPMLSSTSVVGPEYEQLKIELKGVWVQIIRPSSKPDPSGPKMRSPKVRNSAVEKTEAAWFDPDADVVVLVQGSKKAASQNVLKALLKK